MLTIFSTNTMAEPMVMFQLDKKQRSFVVNKMAKELNQQYVFPKIGEKSADFIKQQLNDGAYANFTEGKSFAQKLTQDLQSINHDKHMRVRFTPPPPPPPPSIGTNNRQSGSQPDHLQQLKQKRKSREENNGFYKVERLKGNVGYIDFRYFSDSDNAKQTAISAMKFLENTDALIIDMRKNKGGSPKMVQFICSYFFPEKTHLNSLYWRAQDLTQEYWTLDTVIGKRRIDLPLYILTSNGTFSGAEELSYNFKTRERATLVGEVTGGGANPGGVVRINELFGMFIPMGTAINPITKTNWEGVGVIPDIETSAEQAFDKAYELAQISADKFRSKDLSSKLAKSIKFTEKLIQIEQLVITDKQKALDKIESVFNQGIADEILAENKINLIGYDYLINKKNIHMAILVFSFNTQAYPGSFNAFDSLGEAYLKQGNTKLADKYYKKSLNLNPNNITAQQVLSQ